MTRYAITRTNICSTRTQVYSVWMPTVYGLSSHGTITHINDVLHGRVGTDPLPPEIDAMPARSPQRSGTYRAWHHDRLELAYALIHLAFCYNENGARYDSGEVSLESHETGSETRYVEL